MRVTTLYSVLQRTQSMLQTEENLQNAQAMVASGKRITKPSDDPGAMGTVLQLQAGIAVNQTKQSDATAAISTATAGESALSTIASDLEQIKTLAVSAQNGTNSSSDLASIASQMSTIQSNLLATANSTNNGVALFAGTSATTTPFSAGPPVTYNGNSSPITTTLSGNQPFAISVTGDKIANASNGTDLFSNISNLIAAVKNGDSTGISTAETRLDSDYSNVNQLGGDMGSRIQYLNTVQSTLTTQLTALQQQQSNLVNADVTTSTVNEQSAVTAEDAVYYSINETSNLSLVNYLK